MARLPDGESDSLRQGYLPWLRAGERLAAYEHERRLLRRALDARALPRIELGAARRRHAAPSTEPAAGRDRSVGADRTRRATIVAPVKIGAGAQIGASVTVGPYAVVGEGARVERSITRTVVWAGATRPAAKRGAIVGR